MKLRPDNIWIWVFATLVMSIPYTIHRPDLYSVFYRIGVLPLEITFAYLAIWFGIRLIKGDWFYKAYLYPVVNCSADTNTMINVEFMEDVEAQEMRCYFQPKSQSRTCKSSVNLPTFELWEVLKKPQKFVKGEHKIFYFKIHNPTPQKGHVVFELLIGNKWQTKKLKLELRNKPSSAAANSTK